GVKRRFQMRDGEKFFADGRDNATFELKQKQMRLAGDYRTALRRQVLAQLNGPGRDTRLFSGRAPRPYGGRRYDTPGIALENGDVGFDSRLERDAKELADAEPSFLLAESFGPHDGREEDTLRKKAEEPADEPPGGGQFGGEWRVTEGWEPGTPDT